MKRPSTEWVPISKRNALFLIEHSTARKCDEEHLTFDEAMSICGLVMTACDVIADREPTLEELEAIVTAKIGWANYVAANHPSARERTRHFKMAEKMVALLGDEE
jgi:hypothetical protein